MLEEIQNNGQYLVDPDWLHNIEGLRRGRLPIEIGAQGEWRYQGEPIQREGLIRVLEASLLLIEGRYFIRAPEQLLAIDVEDCPIMITDFNYAETSVKEGGTLKKLTVETATGLRCTVDNEHKLFLKPLPGDQQDSPGAPVVNIRDHLLARFNRNAFYRLVEIAEQNPDTGQFFIYSCGQIFEIGSDC